MTKKRIGQKTGKAESPVDNRQIDPLDGITKPREIPEKHQIFSEKNYKIREIKTLERRVQDRTAELSYAKEILETVFDTIPVMLAFYDDNCNIKFVNRHIENLSGWSLDEIQNVDMLAAIYPDPDYRQEVKDFLKSAAPEWRDFEMRTRDGSIIESSWTNASLSDGTLIGIGIDITKRKQAERAIKELSRKTLETMENDRRAIAKDLHDSIGASLAALKLNLEMEIDKIRKQTQFDATVFENAIKHLMNIIKESKNISARLRPPTLDELGLFPTIRWYMREFDRSYPGFEISMIFDVQETEIPEPSKIAIYRILQEALHNTSKHSRGDWVSIFLGREDDKIRLLIEDNGRGFDTAALQSRDDSLSGCGIQNMQERAEICGGTLRLSSIIGKGTCIEVLLPIRSEKNLPDPSIVAAQ